MKLLAFSAWLVVCCATARLAGAALLSDPAVDIYNTRVGTQTFGGRYQFTTNTMLVETAEAIGGLGSDIIKLYHGRDYPGQYRIQLPGTITNLLTLARDEPSCHRVLDMAFRHVMLWAYPFGNAWPFDGYSAVERANDYQEIYDLTCYLLTNYNHSGKTFYLGHWEGDWYLLPKYNAATNPSPLAIEGMIDWLNNRQQAVDDAKKAMPHANVDVFNYAEVNRVVDAMSANTNINERAINKVVPYVTNLDFVSYSSYDVMNENRSNLWATLDFIRSMLPTNKAPLIRGERLWIGEYGWGTLDNVAQEQKSRSYVQGLLGWRSGPRFILFWEIYNNEPGRAFWLIDSNNVKVASYHFHQRFINRARLLVAQFKERKGRLPGDNEFGPLIIDSLNHQLPPPVPQTVQNLTWRAIDQNTAALSCTLAQGIYGAERAALRVHFGREDGGTNHSAWEKDQFVAVNTNFCETAFTAQLSHLSPGANYYFRFYATCTNEEAWAPESVRFETPP